ncbi:MAG: ADP-ribosylation factor-like protein [Candidatus Thorarchaeota archaeon]
MISILTEHELEIQTRKVLISGIDNAGKSSIQDILKFIPLEAIQRRVPSKDIEISKKQFMKVNYVFFIPPGQMDLRKNELHGSMKHEYFENIDTFIFTIDSSDKRRFDESREELQLSICDLLELSPGCKNFLLFAHKQDLEDALDSFQIKKTILDPLENLYPGIIKQFKIFETSIINPESIHEPFVKAIAKHVGMNRIDFDKLAEWVRTQTQAKITLITDHNGLLIGESFVGKENTNTFAAYVAKIFSAVEDFQTDLEVGGIKIIVLEDEEEKNYSIISRINCSKNDYLALLVGYPNTQIGMARIINKKGLLKLKEAYSSYQN